MAYYLVQRGGLEWATRHEIPVGGVAHVEAGTAQQMVNESSDELLVFVYGAPPERTGADVIDSAA